MKTPSLCTRCSNSLIRERDNGETTHICCYYGEIKRVPHDIVKCNGFADKSRTGRRDMEAIAWVLTTDRKGNTIGFTAPDKRKGWDDD